MMAQGSQGRGLVPNIEVGNVSFPILHSQPFPLSLTPSRADFDFHNSTKQLFGNYFSLQESGHLFWHLQQKLKSLLTHMDLVT